MIRIAICDDDECSLIETGQKIKLWGEDKKEGLQVYYYRDGDSLILDHHKLDFDLIFLDIMMPLFDGMDIAKELRAMDKVVKIIFLTSSSEYALQSYSVKALDYCMKPMSFEALKHTLDECDLFHHEEAEFDVLKTTQGYRKVYLYEIDCIEAQNKHVWFCLNNGKKLEVAQPLYMMEEVYDKEKGFFKCHRSYLVHISNVEYFNSKEIKMRSGTLVPIARGYAKRFQEAYFSMMFHKEKG